MIKVDNVTLFSGTSHKGPKTMTDVILKTVEGKKYFERKTGYYETARSNRAIDSYKQYLMSELVDIDEELTSLLESEEQIKKHNMSEEDKDGWHQYRVLMDKYEACKYLINKKEALYDR